MRKGLGFIHFSQRDPDGSESMNVSLTPELERFVKGTVESGLYRNASEVIREGLRLLAMPSVPCPTRA
jgi:hypothetical protein